MGYPRQLKKGCKISIIIIIIIENTSHKNFGVKILKRRTELKDVNCHLTPLNYDLFIACTLIKNSKQTHPQV